MAKKVIQGEEAKRPYVVPDLLSGISIGTLQEDFPLREVDFDRIKDGKPKTHQAAISILLTSFGYSLSLIPKGYPDVSVIKMGEWMPLGFGLALSLLVYVIGMALPNKRKVLMKDIEEHFKKAPTSRQAFLKEHND